MTKIQIILLRKLACASAAVSPSVLPDLKNTMASNTTIKLLAKQALETEYYPRCPSYFCLDENGNIIMTSKLERTKPACTLQSIFPREL